MISNYFWVSNMAFILFCNSDFLQLVVLKKKYVKQNVGKKMVDKVIDNLTQGRWIPTISVKSENYFDHRIRGIGHIESKKLNPAYMVGSYYTEPSWLSKSNELGVKYRFILGLKKSLLFKSILQFIKKMKQIKKKEISLC